MSSTVIQMKRRIAADAAKLDRILDRLKMYKKKAKLYDKLIASQRKKKKAKKKKRAAKSR